MRKITFIFIFALVILSLQSVLATVEVVSPVNGANYSTSGFFNVSYENTTDITNPTNATFYYNISGQWTAIGNSSTCINNSCSADLSLLSVLDGFYSINATLRNATANVSASVITNNVGFDKTPPAVTLSSSLIGKNFSSLSSTTNGGIIVLNVSVIDATLGNVSRVFFNLTNGSGIQVGLYFANKTGSTNYWSNLTGLNISSFNEGNYTIRVYANDTLNNMNSSETTGTIYFDNTKPTISASDISSPTTGLNKSGNLMVNISAIDGLTSISFVSFKVINATGDGTINASYTASLLSGNIWSATINTSNFIDGKYNITAYVNDSAQNLNNSAQVNLVVFDNTAPVISSLYFYCDKTLLSTAQTLTCTCNPYEPTGLIFSKSFTVNPSVVNTGTHTTTCTGTDYAGNSASGSWSYTVELSGGSYSSSSSGSSTTSIAQMITVKTLTDLEFKSGYTQSFAKNQKMNFNSNNEKHSLGVNNVLSDRVEITVNSTPQKATLLVGEEKKFDLNADGYYDLSVKLNNITNSKASLLTKSIYEQIPTVVPAELETPNEQTTDTDTATPIATETSGLKTSTIFWIVVVILVVVLIIAVVSFIIYKRKKKPSYGFKIR